MVNIFSPFRIRTSTQVCDCLPLRLPELLNKNNAPWQYIVDTSPFGGCRLFGEELLTLKGQFGRGHQTQLYIFGQRGSEKQYLSHHSFKASLICISTGFFYCNYNIINNQLLGVYIFFIR